MGEKWDFTDVEREFYIYIQKNPGHDVLDSLEGLTLNNPECEHLKTLCLVNLRLIFESLSIPFHLLNLGGSQSFYNLVKQLQEKAAGGCATSLSIATHLMNEKYYLVGIQSVTPTFQLIKENSLLENHIQTLYKLGLTRFYGCLEELSKELLKILICHDFSNLDRLESADKRIGRSRCGRLKNKIIEDQRVEGYSLSEAYDENILNKGYQLDQFSELFGILTSFRCATQQKENLLQLEAVRHLITHRSGIVDAKYLNETNSSQAIGEAITITPQEMYDWQNAIIYYFGNLIKAVDDERS